MSVTAIQWRKEIRELLPFWAVTVAALLTCWVLANPDIIPIDGLYSWAVREDTGQLFVTGLCLYSAGAVILGALSLGQEFSYRTLPQLLTLASTRTRLLRIKLTVLSAMLCTLGILAFVIWRSEPSLSFVTDFEKLVVLAVPIASALFLAPWLTMVGRSALGGAVLAVVVPAVIWMLGSSLKAPAWLWWSAAIACTSVGAVMTGRTFAQLQVADGEQRGIEVFAASDGPRTQTMPVGRHNPFVAQVLKELRLQQPTILVTGLYLVLCGLRLVSDRVDPSSVLSNFRFDVVHAMMVPMIAGAMAVADERRLRVNEWHVLLPMAAWRQWLIKAGVALSLALILGFGLSALVDSSTYRPPVTPYFAVFFCAAALYVSSISASALRAVMATAPVIAATLLSAIAIMEFVDFGQPVRWLAETLRATQIDYATYTRWRDWFFDGPLILLALLLLGFAYSNYRQAPGADRVRRQFAWVLLGGIGLMLSLGVSSYLLALLRNYAFSKVPTS